MKYNLFDSISFVEEDITYAGLVWAIRDGEYFLMREGSNRVYVRREHEIEELKEVKIKSEVQNAS